MRKLFYAMVILALLAGPGCATTKPYNPYKVSEEDFHNNVKTIVLAPVYVTSDLQDPEPLKAKFEALIEAKLKEEGFAVIPSREYTAIWGSARDKSGGYYDPVTGKMDEAKFKQVQEDAGRELSAKFKADALLYSGIISVPVKWSGARAGWDGTSEAIMPTGQAVVEALFIQRSGTTAGLSLLIEVTNLKGERLYLNSGGIQLLTKLSGSEFVTVPRDQLFVDEERNKGAIEHALGPLARKSERESKPKP